MKYLFINCLFFFLIFNACAQENMPNQDANKTNNEESAVVNEDNSEESEEATSAETEELLPVEFKLFPNPCTDYFKISCEHDNIVGIEIFDLQLRLKGTTFGDVQDFMTVDVTNMESGIYYVRTYLESKRTVLTKVVLQR